MAQRCRSIHSMSALLLQQRQSQSTSPTARQHRPQTVKPSVSHPLLQQGWLVPCFKLGQLVEEVATFLGESPSNLTRKDHQPRTSILTRQLRVAALFPPSCSHGRCAIDITTPRMMHPCATERGNHRSVDGQLRAVEQGEAIYNHPPIGGCRLRWGRQCQNRGRIG